MLPGPSTLRKVAYKSKARGYKIHSPTFKLGDVMSESDTDEEAEQEMTKELELDDELEMELAISDEE